MFGLVYANAKELSKEEKVRYNSIYCGICRQIKEQCSSPARLGLSYDMAFLALVLMSLYEPEETSGNRACMLHPIHPKPWVDNEIISYCACMNVALGYYKAADDQQDEGKLGAKLMGGIFARDMDKIRALYPRQCEAMEKSLAELRQLEQDNCANPDLPAGAFGRLLGELFVYKEDMWADTLRTMGEALGRFIYLADGVMDYRKDRKKGQYNPFLAMGSPEDIPLWESWLVLAMGRCAEYYERLPLVQDKSIMDNILYSGIWIGYRAKVRNQKK